MDSVLPLPPLLSVKQHQTAAPNTGDISTLLLFDTHAGGNLTDYSFKSHLSISPQETSCPLIKRGLARQERLEGSYKEDDWRNVFLYLGMVTAEIWPVRRRETGFISSLGCFFREESQQRDMLTQTNRTFLGCYLSVSRVLFT